MLLILICLKHGAWLMYLMWRNKSQIFMKPKVILFIWRFLFKVNRFPIFHVEYVLHEVKILQPKYSFCSHLFCYFIFLLLNMCSPPIRSSLWKLSVRLSFSFFVRYVLIRTWKQHYSFVDYYKLKYYFRIKERCCWYWFA